MHQFAGLFRVFSLMFSDPCKISNQNLQAYLLCLLETVLMAATCTAISAVTNRLFSSSPVWKFGGGVPHFIVIVQDEEKN
jgi:ABC-type phosphate/phosphonate transport system permease subunit